MKKSSILIAGLVGLLLTGIAYAERQFPSASQPATVAITTSTNNSALLVGTDGHDNVNAMHILMVCKADKTGEISFVTGTAFGSGYRKLINGASITFPTSTDPFVPSGGVYLIGEEAATLFSNRVTIIQK